MLLLDSNCVNKKGLDFSKEVLCVSVGQRAIELRAVKVGGEKKNSAVQTELAGAGLSSRIFFKSPTLINGSSAAL